MHRDASRMRTPSNPALPAPARVRAQVLVEMQLHDALRSEPNIGVNAYLAAGRLGDRRFLLLPAAGECIERRYLGHAPTFKISPNLLCRIALDAMRTLAAAHALGYVHRDIKPEHIFM